MAQTREALAKTQLKQPELLMVAAKSRHSTAAMETRFSLNLLPAKIVNSIETNEELQHLLPRINALSLKQPQSSHWQEIPAVKRLATRSSQRLQAVGHPVNKPEKKEPCANRFFKAATKEKKVWNFRVLSTPSHNRFLR